MVNKYVSDIRLFNRFYTNVIGLLDQHILDSRYSLPEVRILYEIYHAEGLTAKEIIDIVRIDKGYLSRMLLQFQKKKLVAKKWSVADGRTAHLRLTEKGKKEFEMLNKASENQVQQILEKLSDDECCRLVKNMAEIRAILSKSK